MAKRRKTRLHYVTFLLTEHEYEELMEYIPPDSFISTGIREMIFARMDDPKVHYCRCEKGERKRTHIVLLALTLEEKQKLKDYSTYENRPMSECIRKLLFDRYR